MSIFAWIKHLFIHKPRKEKRMAIINITGNIQKAAITQLRSKTIVEGILAVIYTGPTREDATVAATDFINHLSLHDADKVKTVCGDNFDKIQAAFADQTQGIAGKLADAVVDACKAEVEAQVQTYVTSTALIMVMMPCRPPRPNWPSKIIQRQRSLALVNCVNFLNTGNLFSCVLMLH